MVYLDNAATSFPKPQEVYEKIYTFMQESCANPGRSSHRMARVSAQYIMQTRESIAALFNISNPLRIGFTANATYALNMAIKGILRKGDHVVTTALEHNSVLRPLYELKKKGFINYSIVLPRNIYGDIDPYDIAKAIRYNTRLIIITASSNVTGNILPFEQIGDIAKKHGVHYLLDASQGAGVLPIDVEKMNIDLLAFPGHKGLMGPQGTGGLYCREGLKLKSIIQGGTGSKSFETVQPDFMPDLIESGTLNTPGIVGLGEGIKFILKTGTQAIHERKQLLIKRLYDMLEGSGNIKFYSRPENNSGVLALLIDGMDSSEAANILDSKYQIAVRPGFHCAPLMHKFLKTEKTGLVRISPGYFNTVEEIEYTAESILEIAAGSN
ncbi:MAG: aminotransferase class V-fold PLP-dependent enzyme [Clostridiaceae bacterium]|nr:aminotransferase class V-fold PLP-dependent enzyme [Clostridiaceae bacterium]